MAVLSNGMRLTSTGSENVSISNGRLLEQQKPLVEMHVSALGRVVAFVVEPSKNKPYEGIFYDITKVDFSKGDPAKVQKYKKPISLANSMGYGAPIGWRKSDVVPDRIRDVLAEALPDLSKGLSRGQLASVTKAMNKIGIDLVAPTHNIQASSLSVDR